MAENGHSKLDTLQNGDLHVEDEVFYGRDKEISTGRQHLLLHELQQGPRLGHYVKYDGTTISATGAYNDGKAVFNIYSMVSDSGEPVRILESVDFPGKVVAIENKRVVVKTASKPVGDFTTVAEVQSSDPEILFYKKAVSKGSMLTYFEQVNGGDNSTKYLLGFDEHGRAMTPSKLNKDDPKAQFEIVPNLRRK